MKEMGSLIEDTIKQIKLIDEELVKMIHKNYADTEIFCEKLMKRKKELVHILHEYILTINHK